jgi:hypothetical protein
LQNEELQGFNAIFPCLSRGGMAIVGLQICSEVPARLCFSGVYGEVVLPNGKLKGADRRTTAPNLGLCLNTAAPHLLEFRFDV